MFKKMGVLKNQRNDLCVCFNELLYDCMLGLRYFKQYKQCKMYNDPNLNPNSMLKKRSLNKITKSHLLN